MGYLNGSVDEVAIFNRVLSAQEILDHYRRGALQARFQVRSCTTVGCTLPGETFVGPDGASAAYYSELSNTTTTLPSAALSVPDNRYFQYRLLLDTDNLASSPQIRSVTAAPSHQSISTSQGTCSGTRDVVCSIGTMEPGSIVTVTIVSQVSTLARGRVTNSADLSANETERNRANNTAIAVTPILADTDLSVTQTVAMPSAVAGLPYTYTILVRNSGPEPATTVQLYDRLPEGTSLSSAPTSCSLDGTFLVCAIGDMAAGTTRSVVIVTDVWPETRGDITNTVGVSGVETDPNTGNNSADQRSPVNAVTELTILASAADEVMAGSVLTYTLQIVNWGPSTAMSVTVTDSLPLSATQVVTSSLPFSRTGDVVTWSLGTISPTMEVSMTLAVTVSGSARGSVTNIAGVTGAETDPNPANNLYLRDTVVNASADLVLFKSGTPATATVGTPLTYTLLVTNAGPSDAFDVTLTDTLPASLTVGSVGPAGVVCTSPAGTGCLRAGHGRS